MSEHAFKDDIGAYLLGALSESERRDFEAPSRRLSECRDEVEWLRGAAEALPRSVEQLEPPPTLRAALLEEVGATSEDRRAPGASGACSPSRGGCRHRRPGRAPPRCS